MTLERPLTVTNVQNGPPSRRRWATTPPAKISPTLWSCLTDKSSGYFSYSAFNDDPLDDVPQIVSASETNAGLAAGQLEATPAAFTTLDVAQFDSLSSSPKPPCTPVTPANQPASGSSPPSCTPCHPLSVLSNPPASNPLPPYCQTLAGILHGLANLVGTYPGITFHRAIMPFIVANIANAIYNRGKSPILTYLGPRNKQTPINRRKACGKFKLTTPGGSCDEYPFASTVEGGQGAVVAEVPLKENLIQGGMLSVFYRYRLKKQAGAKFVVGLA